MLEICLISAVFICLICYWKHSDEIHIVDFKRANKWVVEPRGNFYTEADVIFISDHLIIEYYFDREFLGKSRGSYLFGYSTQKNGVVEFFNPFVWSNEVIPWINYPGCLGGKDIGNFLFDIYAGDDLERKIRQVYETSRIA